VPAAATRQQAAAKANNAASVSPQQQADDVADEKNKTPEEVVVARFRPVRDPFRSVMETGQRVAQSGGSTPLQQYSIGQLKLLGIIWGTAEPVGLVATPGGDEFVVKTGTPIGTGDGKVVAILPNCVVIVERYYDYRGQLQTEKYQMCLADEGK